MKSPPTNVAHSVRTRLLTIAKAEGEEFNYVLIRYALERFLVRLQMAAEIRGVSREAGFKVSEAGLESASAFEGSIRADHRTQER